MSSKDFKMLFLRFRALQFAVFLLSAKSGESLFPIKFYFCLIDTREGNDRWKTTAEDTLMATYDFA